MSTKITTVNPFWAEVQALLAAKPKRGANVWDIYYQKSTKDFISKPRHVPAYEHDYKWIIHSSELREKCCKMYAWAIADPLSLDFVAKQLGPRAIEIGAGTGYWAWQLSQLGVDILAFDTAPPDKIPNHYFAPNFEGEEPRGLVKTWYPVTQGGPEVLKEHPDRTLFLCWPPYATDFSHQCLQAYQGDRLVFVGESEGGCTGDDAFFKLLDEDWEEIAEHPVQQWNHINDCIWLYERSNKC